MEALLDKNLLNTFANKIKHENSVELEHAQRQLVMKDSQKFIWSSLNIY